MNYKNLKIKKVESLYNNLLSPLFAVVVLTLIVYYSYQGLIAQEYLTLWMVLNLSVIFLRIFSYMVYKKVPLNANNLSKYYITFFLLSSLTSLVWGTSAFYMIPESLEYRALLILFLLGMISGALVSLATKLEIFYAYLYSSLLPFIYVFYMDEAQSSNIYAFSIFLYVVIISVIAKKNSQTLNENIILVYEKEDLVLKLVEKVEEETVASKAKSDFLSVMSHEIRTPLNAIIGFVNILKKDEQDETKFKYLTTIEKSSNILTNVINDILDISKIESGKFTLEMREFNPYKEFESLYLLFEQNALEKGIVLVNNISQDLPHVLKSDIFRIKQIISNILSNAIKFTSLGKSIYLNIKFNSVNSSLLVTIEDEGIGIAPKNISLITQAFIQADNSTARQYGGSGLGLSIVTKLLHLLGSELNIQSQLHKGSTFSFNIPMQSVQTTIEESQEESEVLFPTKKILVAEDNKTNQMLISILLDDMEIDVSIADDGLIAEDLFKNTDFDMVLMDINMPNKNGIEAMKAIKQFEKENKRKKIPIIALTANAVSGDRQKYLSNGFDEYISKPIEMKELEKVLKLFFK